MAAWACGDALLLDGGSSTGVAWNGTAIRQHPQSQLRHRRITDYTGGATPGNASRTMSR